MSLLININRRAGLKKVAGKSRLSFTMLLCLFLLSVAAISQTSIQNNYFTVQPAVGFKTNPSFTVTHKSGALKRIIQPKLQLIFTEQQTEMVGVSMDGQPGIVAWKTTAGQTSNIQDLGSTELVAQSFQIKNNRIEFSFKENATAKVSLVIKFVPDQQAPVFELGIEAYKNGQYAIGFDGMPAVDSSALDFVYQPLTWTWKRFPSRFALTEEAYANTAAVFTNHDAYSEGLAVSLASIPYRYALAAQWNNAGKADNKFWSVFPADGPKGNSLFGMAIRNKEGKAQPTIYAPLPGTAASRLNRGGKFRIDLVYFPHPGEWPSGTSNPLSSVFHFLWNQKSI